MSRCAIIVVLCFALCACESDEDRAKAAAHAAIKREDEKATTVRADFAARRSAILDELKTLVAAKKWDAASLEASRWRAVRDPEIAAIEATVDAEKEKIYKAAQVEKNRIALAERLAQEKLDREAERANRAWRKKQGVRVGMTQEEVLMSSWGKPQSINSTTYSFGVHEQWVYPGFQYLYFENGKLTAISNKR
jgi:hypothetical protein